MNRDREFPMRLPFGLVALAFLAVAVPSPAPACTFCGGGLQNRQTLREQYANAAVVLHGRLRNPKLDPSGLSGTTEFHVEATLKSDPTVSIGRVVVMPRYYPLAGDAPTEYLLFGAALNGRFDPTFGVPASAATAEYLRATARLPADDPTRRLGFAFAHLDHADPTISDDAFLEFARASDAEIIRAKSALEPAKVRRWLADPRTSSERLGVYALLLGLSGSAEDSSVFRELIGGPAPLPERVAGNLGGLLAGQTLLDPQAGWPATIAVLSDPARPFNERLAAVGTVRFFQAARPESKPQVLDCCRSIIRQGDLADLAIDDLRRWGWWDLTDEVLAKFAAVPPPPPVVRRGVVRYAVVCPRDDAKRFLAGVREQEPQLVSAVEQSLRLAERR